MALSRPGLEEAGYPPRGVNLATPAEKSDKRDHIAAGVAGREVRPAPVSQADPEGAEPAVAARRIQHLDLGPRPAMFHAETVEDRDQMGESTPRDFAKVDVSGRHRQPPLFL